MFLQIGKPHSRSRSGLLVTSPRTFSSIETANAGTCDFLWACMQVASTSSITTLMQCHHDIFATFSDEKHNKLGLFFPLFYFGWASRRKDGKAVHSCMPHLDRNDRYKTVRVKITA